MRPGHLNKAEQRYETTRKELLAVVYGLKQYKQYLLGRHIIIRTDHAALSWLRWTAEPMPQLARWLTLIEQYDYEVVHRPGVKHGNADGLSRRPIVAQQKGATDEPKKVNKTEQSNVRLVTVEQEIFSPSPHVSHEQTINFMLGMMPEQDEQGVQYYPVASEQSPEPPEFLPRQSVNVISQADGGALDLAGEDLAKLQLADKEIGAVVKMRLNNNQAPCSDLLQTESEQTKKLVLKWNELLVKDGLVYRQKARLKDAGHVQPQLLLPRSEVQRAIERCHAGSVGDHFGIEKTLKQVERRFYWIGWKDDVRRYCRSCEQCSKYHRGKLPKHGALQPVLPGAPYERWYIDLTGPHPQSDRGNIWILTCMDSFTKWAEAFPLRSKEAEPIARTHVEQLFTCFGPPLSILSDLGREVDGKIMNEVCKLFGIEKLRTTAYKPSTNQVERFHKTMNSILAKTVAEHQRDWDARLPFAMAAYRATQHDSTGYSPNMLVLGRETRAPPDIIYGAPMDTSEHDYDRFVEQTRDRATQAFYDVRVSLQKRAQRNKKYYDLGLKGADFQSGDWVLYFNPRKLRGKQMKWVRQYEGPFLIIAKPTKLTARIQHSARAQSQVVHVDKLKKFLGKTRKAWRVPGASEQTEQSVPRGTGLVGLPRGADSSIAIGVEPENSGLPVGATDNSVSMSGVDPFSLTPRASDSCLPSPFRHDGAQIVQAEVHREFDLHSPNGQVESVVGRSVSSKQLNEQLEPCVGSEQLTVQPELSMVNEQGVGQGDISPPAAGQRGNFVAESCDLADGEMSSNIPASQMELAVCCDDGNCPLRTLQTAMGTPGRLVTDVEDNKLSCRSYGSDTGIARSPIGERSFAGDFSMINYPADSVGDDTDDLDDDMSITQSDLYADTVAQRARTQTHFDNATNFPSQRPSRNIRRPARFNDYHTQFTQSQHIRRIKISLSCSRSSTESKQTRDKEVTVMRRNDSIR